MIAHSVRPISFKYTELDHQSIIGLHAQSCTQPMIAHSARPISFKYMELDHQSLIGLHAHSCIQPMIAHSVKPTGRQLRTLFSVLYRTISKRRYILAAQLLLREKSGT